MNKTIMPLLLGSVLLTACNPEPAKTETPVAKEDAVAMVNGVAISKATFKTLEDEITARAHGQKFPKEQLLEELIQRELLLQDAQKKHLDQSVEVKERMKMAERSLLSQADLQDYLKTNPISDADVKAEYDKQVAKMSGTEYKARHILVKSEDEAKKLIAELDKGAKFDELAKKHSLDPSNMQGGDLGWFVEGQMVEPFAKAVVGLEKGKYTSTPVQTQFGWHVILREDSRPQVPPPFEAIKDQLRPSIQQQKVQAMLEGLRKQAKVEILMPLDKPNPVVPPKEANAAPAADKPAEPAKAQPTAEAKPEAEPVKTETSAEPAKK